MYFSSLIRKIPDYHAAEHFPFLSELQTALMSVVQSNMETHTNSMPIFENTHTMILEREPESITGGPACIEPLPAENAALVKVLTDGIIAALGGNFRVVLSLLVWMLPGEDVKKHFDSQRGHFISRRFNFIVHGEGLEYTLYIGSKPVVHKVQSGELFELNNRALHAARNAGPGLTTLLVIDLLPADAPLITVEDRTTQDTKFYKSTSGLPLCTWLKA